jgi:hypothetical protein
MNQEGKIPRHEGGCIYCGSKGPFSDEHAVCAGLGGDDGAWLLKDCVCRVCNTDIFSKLETKFLRSSPVALARLFLQPRTRDKGGKTGVPSVQPKASYVRDPDTGILLEAELGAGGSSEVLPQLLIVNAGQIAVTGQDAGAAAAFLSELQKALSDEVTLIEKSREGFEVAYETTPLVWKDDVYALCDVATHARPPKTGIWIEKLIRPETVRDGEALLPRMFRRPAGQLVCRADAVEHAAFFLTVLRNAPELLDASNVGAAGTAHDRPGFHQRHIFDMSVHDRVLTKIALNLVAKLLGLDLIRSSAFDAAVAYAREGKGAICKLPPKASAELTEMLGAPLSDRHNLALLPRPRPNGGCGLAFMARLYGGPAEVFLLTEFEGPIAELKRPIVLLVDYVNHKIERPTIEESKIESARKKGSV